MSPTVVGVARRPGHVLRADAHPMSRRQGSAALGRADRRATFNRSGGIGAGGAAGWKSRRQRRATRRYEAKTSTPAPESWWVPAPAYATEQMQADHESGEDFSYLQFVGLEGNGMFSLVDFPKLGVKFEIPIFIVQGSEDLVTIPEVAKRYFDNIVAPQKEYVLLPRTGHDPNSAMIDAEYDILKNRIVPLLKVSLP